MLRTALVFLAALFTMAGQAQDPAARQRAREMFAKENPPRESTGMIPLTDLGNGTYKGKPGGLYPNGSNTPPKQHLAKGVASAKSLHPLDAGGKPSASGKIVLLSVGMSNTTQEFQAFQRLATESGKLRPNLVLVDGAQGGQTARVTANPDSKYWTVSAERLEQAGVTAAQVQIAWIKQANAMPHTPFEDHAIQLKNDFAATIRTLQQKCPNIKLVYLSSRTYGGLATTPLNPEPYAYESNFAVKWAVEEHLRSSLWVGWGPYLWTDGSKGRKSDGLTWTRADVADDGTHPSIPGRQKIAQLLFDFFATDPTASPWFLKSGVE